MKPGFHNVFFSRGPDCLQIKMTTQTPHILTLNNCRGFTLVAKDEIMCSL